MSASTPYPRLRPVEVFPGQQDGRDVLVVHDPTGVAQGPIAVSPAALFILSLLDGKNGLEDIQDAFREQVGRSLPAEQVASMIDQLDAALYLENERFHQFMNEQQEAYQNSPTRRSADAVSLGAEDDGLAATLARLLAKNERIRPGNNHDRLAGLVAPHLDFARGQRCYADAYGLLAEHAPPGRVVILGTNHFGQAASVVATSKDFETPLGIARTDRAFLDDLQARCRTDLTRNEFDHQREHSVELQVLMLQHVLGPDNFEIVPVLCPDPCGPTGTLPLDGLGVDLKVFAEHLGQMAREAGSGMLIVAGADLSHVGPRFGDDRELDDIFLREVETTDRRILETLMSLQPASFLQGLAGSGNATRVCSAGCLFALKTALQWAEPELLRYHQAVDPDSGTGVTCASLVFWGRASD
ncbi:MAG TPA: AmmeMemoRadiSam system protein B [Phycisphaerae bacterium]|nr:AmmeMemoRadiSam system protein B [Phycisphaerae bacterium]